MIKKILIFIFRLLGIYDENNDVIPTLAKDKTLYETKPFMTLYERKIYNILLKLGDNYKIIPQINLASIIRKKNNNHYYSDLFRNIDFAIFDKECNKLLLLIEIDDSTHDNYKRKQRDQKVNDICKNASIKLIHFYMKYPNNEDYVINRVMKELNTVVCNKENEIKEEITYTLVR